MKHVKLMIIGIVLAAFSCGLCGCAATDSGAGATADQPSARDWVDRQGKGTDVPPWENR